jgi:hypothetical protein
MRRRPTNTSRRVGYLRQFMGDANAPSACGSDAPDHVTSKLCDVWLCDGHYELWVEYLPPPSYLLLWRMAQRAGKRC